MKFPESLTDSLYFNSIPGRIIRYFKYGKLYTTGELQKKGENFEIVNKDYESKLDNLLERTKGKKRNSILAIDIVERGRSNVSVDAANLLNKGEPLACDYRYTDFCNRGYPIPVTITYIKCPDGTIEKRVKRDLLPKIRNR